MKRIHSFLPLFLSLKSFIVYYIMIEKIKTIIDRHKEIEDLLATPEITGNSKKMEELGREYNQIGKVLPVFQEYISTVNNLSETKSLLKSETNQELIAIAQEDMQELEQKLPELEEKVKLLLVPKDPADSKNAIVEIRAGTGGVEAGIFAADLYKMYTSFIETREWDVEVLSTSAGEIGAIKEIIFMVNGENAYGTLKYESGVHRVQRVPQTESQGRIHTSAASVAVLPEADDIEIEIDQNDLRIDVYRSSGPGGQSVNTTDSAVRIVHIPTGITVTCQDEKSQHKNKNKAMKVLKSRLFEIKRSEMEAEESASRKSMVGTGDRSAKIRTYNFPQGRVTDHRINLTLYKLDEILNGNLTEIIDALSIADINERAKNEA
jgi:peptide chain release factor 1